MKWLKPNDSDENIQDRRGKIRGGKAVVGGGVGVVIFALIAIFLGADPSEVMNSLPQSGSDQEIVDDQVASKAYEEEAIHTKRTFNSCNDIWREIFKKEINVNYQDPILEMFTGVTQTACGGASSASGPFYCPADQKVYIDLSFYRELENRFGAGGDLAMSYVIAHEVGHHVQNLLGLTDELNKARGSASERQINQLSVKVELQADFLAGVWAHYSEKAGIIQLEAVDIESALNAANAIGDDNIQKKTQGRVVPESFTHGTSEQRVYWFKKGYETGDLRQGNP